MSALPVTTVSTNIPYGLTRLPQLGSPVLQVVLPDELQALARQFSPEVHCGRTARTIVKYPDLRIVVVALQEGARLEQHQTAARFAMLVISGHVRLHLADTTWDVPAGQLLALDRETPHDVEAILDSTFLLIVAWPSSQSRATSNGSASQDGK